MLNQSSRKLVDGSRVTTDSLLAIAKPSMSMLYRETKDVRHTQNNWDNYLLVVLDGWKHFFCHISQLCVSLLLVWLFNLRYDSQRVDNENHTLRHTYIDVARGISHSIAKPTVEGSLVSREKLYYVSKTCNFEHLGFSINDFAVEGSHQTIRTHDERTSG